MVFVPAHLNVPARIRVQIANMSAEAQTVNLDRTKLVQLSPSLARALSVPDFKQWQFLYTPGSHTLKLGPVVAILARRSLNAASTDGTAGELNCLGQVAETLPGLFYLLRPEAVLKEEPTFDGHIYQGRRWIAGSFPHPQAVYDQIYSRKSEKLAEVIEAKKILMKITNNRYFNPHYFDKWQITQVLRQTEVKSLMPDTRLFTSSLIVMQMLSKYGAVFLKPTNGTLGHGIIRLAQTPNGYKLTTNQGLVREFSSFNRAMAAALTYMTSRSYLVQQEIRLLRYQGHPFDVRVLIQKDDSGKFKITKVFARVAIARNIVTNLASGGNALPLKTVLKEAWERAPEPIIKRIRSAAYKIAACLELSSGTSYGELGIDLGIDQNGRLWLIEVNSKPRRAVETEGNPELVRLSYLRPLLYASYLAGFREVKSNDDIEGGPRSSP